MATYRELLAQTRAEIEEVSPARASELLQSAEPPLFVDVREQGEWDEGHIPGAAHIPRGNLESRIDGIEPDRSREIVLYCASGSRSAFAAKTLGELGYENVVSLAEGYREWKSQGHPWEVSRALDSQKRARYSRHVLIPEVGEAGQLKLLDSRILLVGAGGLGSPAALYLAAAGVGTIGLIDADVVDASNLQRQVLHSTTTIGEPKVDSARRALEALNPDVTVRTFQERLTSENVDKILSEGWDVIVDGADNFPTRYLVNDASVWHGIPVVHGSIFRFEGQVTVFKPRRRSLLSVPVPAAAAARARAVVRRGRRAGRAARRDRLAAGLRGAEARARGHRRLARRPAAALRRALGGVQRGADPQGSELPRLRRAPDDHRVRRLRRVLCRRWSTRMISAKNAAHFRRAGLVPSLRSGDPG